MAQKAVGGLVFLLAVGTSVVSCGADQSRAQPSSTVTVTASAPSVAPLSIPASSSSPAPLPSWTPPPSPSPSPSPATFEQTNKEVESGVVRIDAQGCEGAGTGTGFLIGSDLVATAAHVVSDTATLRVTQETTSVSATVVGFDAPTDTALIRTSKDLTGHRFVFRPEGPMVAEPIGVIGFPAGDTGVWTAKAGPKSYKQGSVSGLNGKLLIGDDMQTSLVQIDAPARPGSSGSPVIDIDGDVVGVLSAGPGPDPATGGVDMTRSKFAVNSKVAAPLFAGWATTPAPVEPADCSAAVESEGQPLLWDELPGSDGREVATTLSLYFDSINQGDYLTAYAQKHPTVKIDEGSDGPAMFAEQVASSYDTDVWYMQMSRSGRDLVVWTEFRSRQDAAKGPEGLSCTDWSLDYTMRPSDGLWLIVKSAAHDGQKAYTPC